MGVAPSRMADCEVIDPVVLSQIHGVILHPPAVTDNEKLPQKGTKNHKNRMHRQNLFSWDFVLFRGYLSSSISRKSPLNE